MASLIVDKVDKAFTQGDRRIDVLREVSLHIDEPGFYAVMGPSGSGKSTLLHLLAGLDRPDAGSILIDDTPIHTLGEAKLTAFRRRNIGIVFQQFNLVATLTAAQNVGLPGVIDGRSERWIRERVAELLDRLGITQRAGHRPDAMSGGEQQRAAIARALLFQPPVLLADEPTGALDTASSERLWSLLGEVAEAQGVIALMVTHEPAAAVHCRRVFVLIDGAVRGDFETEGLDAARLADRYQQLGR